MNYTTETKSDEWRHCSDTRHTVNVSNLVYFGPRKGDTLILPEPFYAVLMFKSGYNLSVPFDSESERDAYLDSLWAAL